MDNRRMLQTGMNLVIVALLLVGCGRQEIAPHLDFVEVQKNGIGGVDGLRGAWSVTVSPDGKHVYATGYRDDAVAVFSRNHTTGTLTFVEAEKDDVNGVDGLGRACSATVSPDGKHVYAAGHLDHMVAVFSRDQTTGKLTFVETQQDGIGGVDGLSVIQWVTVSPDGRHVYTAGYRGYAVTVFSRDETMGTLTFVEVQKDDVNGVDGLRGASCVTVSPDGEHVYAAGYFDSAVAVFRRDRATGRLTFIEVQRDGLQGACFVVQSPDGRHVYVASAGNNSVAVFRRNQTTGKLAFVEAQQGDLGSVDGLQGVLFVVVSPNGRYVYATGRANHALSVFRRDKTTGRLTFVEVQRDGLGGVDGLQGASCVAVSPDGNGRHVYVAGNGEQAVSVFKVLHP